MRTINILPLLVLVSASLAAQNQQAPAFEVASVKRNTSGSLVVNSSVQGDRYTGTNLSVMDLLSSIYEIPRARYLELVAKAVAKRSVDLRWR